MFENVEFLAFVVYNSNNIPVQGTSLGLVAGSRAKVHQFLPSSH
jgi:hypothetical protein